MLKHKLKKRNCRGLPLRTCHSGVDITSIDLEKNNRIASHLVSGRILLDIAKRGSKQSKKALSFCNDK